MDHFQTNWGRPRDDIYGSYDKRIHEASDAAAAANIPTTNTQAPIVTGTSVIAIKFNKGVIIAADNLASYGSLARFTDVERLLPVGRDTVVGVGGDISDYQYLQRVLEQLEINDNYDNDGLELTASNVFHYISNIMYNRRSRMNPLWNAIVVAGVDPVTKEPFLSTVDLRGVTYSAPTLATGFGAYLAVPLLRQLVDDEKDVEKVTEEEARKMIDTCMKVLFYRDARSLDKYSVATITADGVKFDKNVRPENMNWNFAGGIKGYGTQDE
ncbi:uncharacterized protein SAPINGB_P002582 [Magnusiomyces paraingens]|uniref:Proteasome subunit beta n=1 Tax=Magnusiomyces paraingens TaxID=2606893 RepID=A0A5E8BEN9_9ASCO|nr:uncharacterized protein SAPINGB_P002582 [Saprochaete ingens]VVT50063.1 unnamed protein product [Saprochaete ingens]